MIKSDRWIIEQAHNGMITPFEPRQVKEINVTMTCPECSGDGLRGMVCPKCQDQPYLEKRRVISYGTSSYGYDFRVSNEFKIFTATWVQTVDPKNFSAQCFDTFSGDVCIIPPNSFALARTVEYFKIPRNVITICLGKSTYARCFTGDTKVALANGTSKTLEQMADYPRHTEYGYGIDEETGRFMMTSLRKPRFIGTESVIRVCLDNGERIDVTPDHLFLALNGDLIAAGDLRPGVSLQPLYRYPVRGYEVIGGDGHMTPTHRLADDWNIRHDRYIGRVGEHRHHKDEVKINNYPTNIERKNASKHIRDHNDDKYEYLCSEAHRLAIVAGIDRAKQSEEWVEQYRLTQKQKAVDFWSLPDYAEARERLLRQRQNVSEVTRQRMSDSQRAAWCNEDRLQQHSQRMKEAWSTDDKRRANQASFARSLNIRPDITEEKVREALQIAGTKRGAARLLGCDRSVFRRFNGLEPKNHKVVTIKQLRGVQDVFCLTASDTGNFALEAGVIVRNCGLILNTTPFEPSWCGHATIEISNTTPLPAKVYANEGIGQLLFFEADEACITSYADKQGKYQNQTGVQVPLL